MSFLASLPVLALTVILQSTIFSRVTLLNGTLDLVVIVLVSWALNEQVEGEWVWALVAGAMVGFVSAQPIWVSIASYLLITALAVYLKRRVWQIPVLALFITVLAATLIVHAANILMLGVMQIRVPLFEAFNLIVLPGLLLNLLAALPVNGLISELADWIAPKDLDA